MSQGQALPIPPSPPLYPIPEGALCFITDNPDDDPDSWETLWVEARRTIMGSFEVTWTKGKSVVRKPKQVRSPPFADAAERILGPSSRPIPLPR